MEYPRSLRTVVALGLGATIFAGALTACSPMLGGEESDDPNAKEAAKLRDAQLVQFGDAKVLPEQSEQGTYSRLATVRQTEELRESAGLDQHECLDAASRWGRLPEVREAPTALATFLRGEDTIAHMLIATGEAAAQEVVDAPLPDECESYEGKFEEEDGTVSYRVDGLDIEDVADASRAYGVVTETAGEEEDTDETLLLYSLLYRNGDNLGITTIFGIDEDRDYEETLKAFTEAAVEREDLVFPR
ncbi:hypothetical protein HNR23_004677 [Nocardiopsis mwathae]|uniref:Lipoprotein n=1 Tax=Nocardiopsis mwathae TaxID=1472723 RepID=A0A7X0D7G7_9ACTN|nr:hypothetical protein [Nocardiopsis mwathae]MBB6174617.1 hypothetical protein [Nocardiopsis mwathae]